MSQSYLQGPPSSLNQNFQDFGAAPVWGVKKFPKGQAEVSPSGLYCLAVGLAFQDLHKFAGTVRKEWGIMAPLEKDNNSDGGSAGVSLKGGTDIC